MQVKIYLLFLFVFKKNLKIRLIYLLSIACSNDNCFTNLKGITSEMIDCIVFLYVGSIVLLILGIYLYEVIPQEYGIRKHPFFCIKRKKKMNKKKFSQDCELLIDSNDSNLDKEDQDSKNERKKVYLINQKFSNFPLICKDLKKVYKNKGHYK